MAEGDEKSSGAYESTRESILESIDIFHTGKKKRLFGRKKSLHDLLGGGHYADVLLWRKKQISGGLIASATIIWVIFERLGCHLVSVVSLLLLASMITLFVWCNAAAFFNRPPPPFPKVQLSDDLLVHIARTIGEELNRALSVLYDISMGKDLKLFLEVLAGLWFLVILGGWFHFLTLVYIGVVAAHSFPVIYEKHEDTIDDYADKAMREMYKLYRKLDDVLLSKIPRGPKRKKDD